MSEPIPERADIRQLRTQAKELLRSLQSGQAVADDVDPSKAKLSDAQRLTARKHGFDSWPQLVDKVETPALIEKFKGAIEQGDPVLLEKLLRTKSALRKRINEPMFSFDSQAVFAAGRHARAAEMLPILVRYGADPNARTRWWAGGFGALDNARAEAVEVLLRLGARWDVWSAAAQGRIEVLRELLDQDPELVNAPGGDGQTPLHFAANAEVAEFLIERGADLEQRDVDHEGTPIQHHVNDSGIVRLLLKHGAKPDIFTAAAVGDSDMARLILAADPEAAGARVGQGAFATHKSDGGHIYTYKIGPTMTPHGLAAKLGNQEVTNVLLEHAPPSRRLVAAALTRNAAEVEAILSQHPGLGREMGEDARAITDAAQEGKTETVRLLLAAGLDPTTPGMDSGSALHVASWFGHADVVRLLVSRVPLDIRDANHPSTPLSWALHGAQWCRNPAGNYVAVVETLLEAGAELNTTANSSGTSMLEQAGSREDVRAVLRKYGAT